jgi:hypothetical protein
MSDFDFMLRQSQLQFAARLREAIFQWMNAIVKPRTKADERIEFDWFREAAMSAVELGLPLQVEVVMRLLTDQDFFVAQIPMPLDSPDWEPGPTRQGGRDSGTECVQQWWTSLSPEFRQQHTDAFRRCFTTIPKVMAMTTGYKWWLDDHMDTQTNIESTSHRHAA